MRLFYAALALEANTFLPLPTSYQAFVEKVYFPPGQYPAKGMHQTGAMDAMRARAKGGEFELIEGSCYAAQPGGAARSRNEISSRPTASANRSPCGLAASVNTRMRAPLSGTSP